MTLPELRGITAREFEAALERDGFVFVRGAGSHRMFQHRDGRCVVVTHHAAGRTFRPGTLTRMLRSAKWSDGDLVRLGLVRRRGSDRAAA